MLNITPSQRRALRAEAHALNPVVMIADAGLTPNVMKEIELSLEAHGLIKVRVFGDDRANRISIYEQICAELNAAPVQHIGKQLVIYRPKKDAPVEKESSAPKGKGLKKVTIVKKSKDVTRRPITTKTMIKGNQRLTQGGSVKREKQRQVSEKKNSRA